MRKCVNVRLIKSHYNFLDLVKMRLEKPNSGSSLARIAVEVGEEEDIKNLIQSASVQWNETVEGEDPAILWALKNEKFQIVDLLMAFNEINLRGDPSTDLTIHSASESFRVHKYFFCSKSPVFCAMLNSNMREDREREVTLKHMNSSTVSSMIHYFYTGELADGWKDLDVRDVAETADQYDLSDWMMIFCSALETEEMSGEKVAEMMIVGTRYQHSAARELTMVARNKIRERREITRDLGFRERLRREDHDVLFEFLEIM